MTDPIDIVTDTFGPITSSVFEHEALPDDYNGDYVGGADLPISDEPCDCTAEAYDDLGRRLGPTPPRTLFSHTRTETIKPREDYL